jgi:hypothetical protein
LPSFWEEIAAALRALAGVERPAAKPRIRLKPRTAPAPAPRPAPGASKPHVKIKPRTGPVSAPKPRIRVKPKTAPIIGDSFPAPEKQLPDGWTIAGLYRQGEGVIDVRGMPVTDRDVIAADGIVVWYQPAGADGYRWIHGARSIDAVGDLIDKETKVVSPV